MLKEIAFSILSYLHKQWLLLPLSTSLMYIESFCFPVCLAVCIARSMQVLFGMEFYTVSYTDKGEQLLSSHSYSNAFFK